MDRSGKKVCIRREIREDLIAIRRINEKAFGGIQEDGRRAGLTDVPAIVGFGEAARPH